MRRSRAPGVSRVDNGGNAGRSVSSEPDPQAVKAAVRDFRSLEKNLKTKSLVQLRAIYDVEQESFEEAREVMEQKLVAQRSCLVELRQAQELEIQAEAKETKLHQEAAEVAADVAVLVAGLPSMLQGRCNELQTHIEEVGALTEECAATRSRQNELEETRHRCRQQVDCLWHEAEDWRHRNRPMPRQRSAVDERIWSLNERSKRAAHVADELEATIQYREQLHGRHVEELAELSWRAGGLRTQLDVARRRHEESATDCWEQTESFCLAKRLEIEGLRRALTLRHQHLQVKSRESSFYHDRATKLKQELESATATRDREVSELMRPPSYTPVAPEGPRPEAMLRSDSNHSLRVDPMPLNATSATGMRPQVPIALDGPLVSSPVPLHGAKLVALSRRP